MPQSQESADFISLAYMSPVKPQTDLLSTQARLYSKGSAECTDLSPVKHCRQQRSSRKISSQKYLLKGEPASNKRRYEAKPAVVCITLAIYIQSAILCNANLPENKITLYK